MNWVYPQQNQNPYQDRLTQLQNQYMNAMPQAQGSASPVNQGLLWVQGENAARSYLVAPNSTVLLMDSDASRFYLKSADNAGMPNLRIFEYKEVPQNVPEGLNQAPDGMDNKYVTREEYIGLQAKYEELLDKINAVQNGGNDDGQSTV